MRIPICLELCQSAIAIGKRSRLSRSLGIEQKGSITRLEILQVYPLERREWIGQFRSAVDSQSTLSDEVKLTYLKTLVTGKPKLAIADFAYSGRMYRDALRVLERKYRQTQTVVSAHLEKLNDVPPVKMHNLESIINFACVISGLIGVFRLLSYRHDLTKTASLNQAFEKLPPNMKESWSAYHMFRHCPKARKCTKAEFESTHKILLHGADRIFSPGKEEKEAFYRKNLGG